MACGFYETEDVCQRVEDGYIPRFIGFNEASSYVPEATWLAREFPHERLVFRATNQVAQAIAARARVGLALLPHYIERVHPALRLCWFDPVTPPREIWTLTRHQDRKDMPIRTVTDYIMRRFADERALFEA